MARRQLENISPIMRQVLPLVEQLPPLYLDLAKGREDFSPKPEETKHLVWIFRILFRVMKSNRFLERRKYILSY